MAIALTVNGRRHELAVAADTPLLWVLRDTLKLHGTKFGCGIGVCGACTIHLDGAATRSCILPLGAVAGRSVTTIEGLSPDRTHPVQAAWLAEDVPQCGYCQSGMIMATAAAINAEPDATEEDLCAAIGNICRCGTYSRIRRAIRRLLQSRGRAVDTEPT
jgi:aerobic-type carbon monoxide dehydrogenase small subunit (CoxS/CutS family)